MKTDKAPEVILLNHTLLGNVATFGSATAEVDVTGYFRGGKEPVTYANVTTALEDPIFEVVLDEATGQLTVTATDPKATPAAGIYRVGETVSIKAIDADKISAADPVMLMIKANKAPTAGDPFTVTNALTVGTQTAKDALRDGRNNDTDAVLDPQPNPVCATFASCVFTIQLQTGDANADTHPATLTRSSEDSAVGMFASVDVIEDEDTAGMMFSIVEYDEKVVRASASGNKITIDGVKSTYVAGETNAHEPIAVKIMATDAKDLTVERNIMVKVDAAPTLNTKRTFLSRYEFTADDTAQIVITGLANYFVNAEPDVLTYTITSNNHAVVAMPPAATDPNMTAILGQGTATVTITATDAREQTVKAEFVVNVKPPTP